LYRASGSYRLDQDDVRGAQSRRIAARQAQRRDRACVESIEERRFADANEYAVRTAAAIEAYAKRLDAALAVLDAK
jgi:hypothetical protein